MSIEEADKFVAEFVGPTFSIFKMTPEQRLAIMKANPPHVEMLRCSLYLNWSWKACGFGQFSLSISPETGEICCDSEGMGRESVRMILHAMADHLADTVKL